MKDKSDDPWNRDAWIEKLAWSRKSMWHTDTVERLAVWMGLKPGLTAVDVGCGLGYLAYTYWPYFGKGGRYFGLDSAAKVIANAARAAGKWVADGEAHFIQGDAYALPLPDGLADWVMCQALLMHLKDPESALAEMIRVAKPGGLVTCLEIEEFPSWWTQGHISVPEMDIEEQLLVMKGALLYHRGRIKLGRGDTGIAPKIPAIMQRLGLGDIDVRTNDLPIYLLPPYEGQIQQDQLYKLRRFLDEQAYQRWKGREKEAFLAGGGGDDEYERYSSLSDRAALLIREQIENGEFSVCHVNHFYVIKGRTQLHLNR
jgi:SAM-dependent methyltransferase